MSTNETLTQFLEAVCEGDTASARAILATAPELALEEVAVAGVIGDADRVALLLNQDPARATTPAGSRGWVPLLYVAHSRFHHDAPELGAGIARAAKLLIDRGADANTSYIDASFPDSPLSVLYIATGVTNNPALARVLLEEGANPNDGESIYHAAEANNRECLELLVEHGADISGQSEPWGNTVLYFLMGHHEATTMGASSTEGMRWLLEHGADPNVPSYASSETPLHLAVRSGRSAATVKMLLEHGADPNARDSNGRTAYALAVRSGNGDVAELLRQHGAADELTLVDRFIGACSNSESANVAAMLAEHPTLREGLSLEDLAILPAAASHNRIDAVRTMLDAGFDIAAPGEAGATALHHAAWMGHSGMVDLLLEHNPPLEAPCAAYKGTPLDWAVHGSFSSPNRAAAAAYVAIVESILAAGANPQTALIDLAQPEIGNVIRRYAGTGRA